jgi:hypothetical protein
VIPRSPASTPDPPGLPFPVSTPLSGRHTTVGNRPPAGLGGRYDHDRAGRPVDEQAPATCRQGTSSARSGTTPPGHTPTRTTSPSRIITQQHSFTHSGRQLPIPSSTRAARRSQRRGSRR